MNSRPGQIKKYLFTMIIGVLIIQTGYTDDDTSTITEPENATYRGIEASPVTLSDGHWQGEPWVIDGAARPTVGLIKDFQFKGDLDGDGIDETVVFLWQNSGGTGSNIYIAVMSGQNGDLKNIATNLVGDRVKLRSGVVQSGKIGLEVLQAGENDAMCCPGMLATRFWTLNDGQLQEGEIEMTGRLSLATLDGTEWTLTRINQEEPLSEKTEVTLAFRDDNITGKSACNRYSAGIEEGDIPGSIVIGPTMGTRMACADELMNIEREYLDMLSRVTAFSFDSGKLLLSGQANDGALFTMRFTKNAEEAP